MPLNNGTLNSGLNANYLGGYQESEFLHLTGGTMTGNINWNTDSHGIYFYNGCGIEKWDGHGPSLVAETGTTFEISSKTDRSIRYTILHSGNYSTWGDTRYLKLTGGTLTGSLNFSYGTTSTDQLIGFSSVGDDPQTVYLGIRRPLSSFGPVYKDKSGTFYSLLHEGNWTSIVDGRYVKKTGDTMTGRLRWLISDNNYLEIIHNADGGIYWHRTNSYWFHIASSGAPMFFYTGDWDNTGQGNYYKGITITTANKIGIGVSNPQVKLHVVGANGETLRLSMPSSNYTAGAGPSLSFVHGENGEMLAWIKGVFDQSSQGNYGNLQFATRTSDAAGPEVKMTILHNGNVGIGTTTPQTKLHVSGKFHVYYATESDPTDDLFASSFASFGEYNDNALWIGKGTSSVIWLQSAYKKPSMAKYNLSLNPLGGKVGINTLSPSYTLDVTGTGRFTSEVQIQQLIFHNNNEINCNAGDNVIWLNSRYAGNIYAVTGGGKLGVGTSSPSEKLHVAGNIYLTGCISLNGKGFIQSGKTSSFHYGYTFPPASDEDYSNSIGIFSGPKSMASNEEGGLVITPDNALIYNSFDCGWGLQVFDKDLGSDFSANDHTNNTSLPDEVGSKSRAFGIRSTYVVYSRGGYQKMGSSNSYVLLGGGGHKAISEFKIGDYLPLAGGTMTGGNINWTTDSHGIYFYGNCGIEKWDGYGPTLVAEGNNTNFWIRNGTDRTKNYIILHTGNYTSYLGYIGTTAVQSSSAAQALTGITSLAFNGQSASTNYITGAAGSIYFGGNFHIDSSGNNDTYINYYTGKNVFLCAGSSQGKVGIRTSSPSYPLHTVGKIGATSSNNTVQLIPDSDCGLYMTTSGQWIHIAGSGGTMYIYNGTWDAAGKANYSKGIQINTSNNIGIGTAPNVKFHIMGSTSESLRLSMPSGNYTAGAGPLISFVHGQNGEMLASIQGAFYQSSQGNYGNLYFGTRTSDSNGVQTKMTILYNGNVGIGYTVPDYKLHVNGAGKIQQILIHNNNEIDNYDGDKIIFLNYRTTGNVRMVEGGGMVGIGTAPSYKLHVAGAIYTSNTFISSSTEPLRFYGAGSGTYNQSVVIVNSSGITLETPRATDAGNANILPFYIKTRGGQYAPIYAQKFVTANGTSAQFVKGDGSLDSNTYVSSAALDAYLPLTGGTMTGNISWNTDSHGLYLYNGCGIEKWSGYGPSLVAESGTTFEISSKTDRSIRYTILHSGNYTNYTYSQSDLYTRTESNNRYVYKSGDTMTGGITFKYGSTSSDMWITFKDSSSSETVYLGIRKPLSSYGPTYVDKNGNYYTLIHTGNIGNYTSSVSVTNSAPALGKTAATIATIGGTAITASVGDADKVDGLHFWTGSSLPSSTDSNTIYIIV